MKAQNTKEKWILLFLCSSMFLASVGTSIANVALPELSQAFSVSYTEIKWVIIIYLLANTLSIVGMGRLGDLFGRLKVLRLGILIFSLSSFLCAYSPHLQALLFFRVGQGVGAAILMALSVALVGELLPKEKMGKVMGLLGSSSAVGTASGPSIGGILLTSFGWPSVFIFMGLMGLLCFVFSLKTQNSFVQQSKPKFFFKDKTLIPNLLMNICVSAVMMSTLIVGPFYLSQTLGQTTMMVGVIMTVGPLMSIVSGIPAGRAVDQWGSQKVMRLGLFLLLIGSLSFSFLPSVAGVFGYIFSAMILSPGYQMFQAANNSKVMLGTSDDQRGMISGLLSLSRNVGLIAGAAVMGSIYASQGMSVTFLFSAGIALIALLIALNSLRIILIGIGATMLMDVWSIFLKLFGIRGLNMGHLGRLLTTPQYEVIVGWCTHYFIGIIFCFLLVGIYGDAWLKKPNLKAALIFGFVTVLAPLMILQPALGLGFFASNSPDPLFAVIKSCVTHLVYGSGLYLFAFILRKF